MKVARLITVRQFAQKADLPYRTALRRVLDMRERRPGPWFVEEVKPQRRRIRINLGLLREVHPEIFEPVTARDLAVRLDALESEVEVMRIRQNGLAARHRHSFEAIRETLRQISDR